MKKLLSYITVFLLGITLTQVPDLISIYDDYAVGEYQKIECKDKGIGPNQCHFDMYYYKYADANPNLVKVGYYFQLGEGPLYWIATARCSNKIFYNPSASPKGSGKMTMREYFYSRCSKFMNDVSDIFYE